MENQFECFSVVNASCDQIVHHFPVIRLTWPQILLCFVVVAHCPVHRYNILGRYANNVISGTLSRTQLQKIIITTQKKHVMYGEKRKLHPKFDIVLFILISLRSSQFHFAHLNFKYFVWHYSARFPERKLRYAGILTGHCTLNNTYTQLV